MKNEYSKIKEKVLNYIKKEKLEPRPKWYFVIKNETVWAMWVISIIIGAISISVLIFSLANVEWEFYLITHGNFFNFLIDFLPFVWIFSLFIFTFIAYKNFKNTKTGYKYSITIVLSLSILISIIGGVIFYTFGFGEVFDEDIGGFIPLHRPMIMHKQRMWMNPANGLIVGEVIKISSDFNSFSIKSPNGEIWFVDGSDLSEIDREILSKFRIVRIIGTPIEKNGENFVIMTIKGCAVLPFEIIGKRFDEFGSRYPQQIKQPETKQSFSERKIDTERNNRCRDIWSARN